MRTARLLTLSQQALGVYPSMHWAGRDVYPSMHWAWGSALGEGVSASGPGGVWQTSPPCEQNDRHV